MPGRAAHCNRSTTATSAQTQEGGHSRRAMQVYRSTREWAATGQFKKLFKSYWQPRIPILKWNHITGGTAHAQNDIINHVFSDCYHILRTQAGAGSRPWRPSPDRPGGHRQEAVVPGRMRAQFSGNFWIFTHFPILGQNTDQISGRFKIGSSWLIFEKYPGVSKILHYILEKEKSHNQWLISPTQ